jgi:hypothetical protein
MRLVQDDGELPETWEEQTTMFAYFLAQEGAYELSRHFLEALIAETGHPAPDLLRSAHDALRAFREGRRDDAARHRRELEELARTKHWDLWEARIVACLTGAILMGMLGDTDAAARALAEAGENGARALPVYSVIEPLARGRTDEALAEMTRFRATVPGSRDVFFRLLGLVPWNAPGAAAALCGEPSAP